ncbi:MAG: thiamine phosphate synthase [Hyphomicrobiaceae bacterium]|nr:thiamine phosphate synthase [Hyphomicrobiaceae bacterium]
MSELYLIAEIGGSTPDSDRARIAAALGAASIPSVLLRPVPGGTLEAGRVKPLVEQVQAKGIAALVADDAELARVVRADGVHLSWSKDQPGRMTEAREILGGRYMLGADAGRSRDDAMTLGEMGADYVGFGIPPHVEDRATAFARQCDLLSWWAEIFEPPCIALDVPDAEAAGHAARANADFVSVTLGPEMTPEDAAALVKTFSIAIGSAKIPA